MFDAQHPMTTGPFPISGWTHVQESGPLSYCEALCIPLVGGRNMERCDLLAYWMWPSKRAMDLGCTTGLSAGTQ